MIWFWVNVPYACGGIATDERGIVRDAAPIFRRRAMGRPLNDVIREWRRQGVSVEWRRLQDSPAPAMTG